MIGQPKRKVKDNASNASYTDSDYSGGYSDDDSEDEDIPVHLRVKKNKVKEVKNEKHMAEMLKSLNNFVESVATNLGNYCDKAKAAFESNSLESGS